MRNQGGEDITQDTQFKLGQLWSMVNSLKEIMTIIVGLALTNSIIQREIKDIRMESVIIFVLSVITMIRFYHGNFRHLDVTYSFYNYKVDSISQSVKQHPREEKVSLDFFFILIESLILGLMSFYQRIPLYFFLTFIILLIVDVFWFFLASQLTESKEVFKHQRYWTISNFITIIALLFALLFMNSQLVNLGENIMIYVLSFIIFANSFLDYKFNWTFYFPAPFKKEGESR
jgi:hypothetical protein